MKSGKKGGTSHSKSYYFAFLSVRSRERKRCAAEALARGLPRVPAVWASLRTFRIRPTATHTRTALARSLVHVKRQCVSVSHCCPVASSTAGAHHKCEIQEWPFPGVSFPECTTALGGDLGSVSDLCRMQMCIQKSRIWPPLALPPFPLPIPRRQIASPGQIALGMWE